MVPRIVITGAPASGKTVFFERLKSHPAFAGFIFFEELARRLLEENPDYRHRWAEFHREIYRRQVAREDAAGDRPFVTDRGTVDAFAFHPETVSDVGTTLEREYRRYSGVIQLGAAAALGERYHVADDVRNEAHTEALEIEEKIRAVWKRHPGYQFISAERSFEIKYARFVRTVTAMIAY